MVKLQKWSQGLKELTKEASISEKPRLFSLMSKEDGLVGVKWRRCGGGGLHARFHSHHSVMLVSWQTEAQTHQRIIIQV